MRCGWKNEHGGNLNGACVCVLKDSVFLAKAFFISLIWLVHLVLISISQLHGMGHNNIGPQVTKETRPPTKQPKTGTYKNSVIPNMVNTHTGKKPLRRPDHPTCGHWETTATPWPKEGSQKCGHEQYRHLKGHILLCQTDNHRCSDIADGATMCHRTVPQ